MNNQSSSAPSVQEYSIRVPKNVKKKFHVMRFNPVSNIDFTKWSQVRMERENNIKEFRNADEEQPKFGAGSEYGREAREEARRKKYGIITRKYKPEDQPWILKIGGKTGKKFKGIREGGVAENASYYVFTHAADGGIEAYPLTEWYNFQPIQRYKALSAEEAEQEFGRRNKVMNYFSLMLRKRLKKDEEGDGEEGEELNLKKGKRKSNDLKISEMDDWIDSDDESSSNNEGGEEDEEKKEKKAKEKKKKGEKPKTKKQKGSDESAFEESDDGDEEGRELDYISDSSDSVSDHEGKIDKEMKGVAEESALRRLLTSDEDEEDEENKKEEGKEGEKENKEAEQKEKESKKRKRKKKPNEKKKAAGDGETSSDSSGDSSDSEVAEGKKDANSASNSRCPSPVDKKTEISPTKKAKIDHQPPMLSYGGENGITEEAVRRYLMRKPMTTTELLQKFKGRKTGLSSEQLVNVMTQILKRINPVKQTIKNKMYLSIRPQ
ncbi:general transcription factor IIF subunit 1 [Halyomorpha halys]|uniref:general transcription factor IIF subunit 1 n=1 Tax=Halyomorpha halys TaxID=286706 RepID=UPI0006D4DB0C|nr:general transcription factor IIF subunit 1 [Halyomorpha halys]